jgi:hypothetical protein
MLNLHKAGEASQNKTFLILDASAEYNYIHYIQPEERVDPE